MHTIASRWRALLAVGACIASATAQFHVAVTGNDANSGTAGSPFRTIAHAALVAPAGSIIRVHAGTYGDEQGGFDEVFLPYDVGKWGETPFRLGLWVGNKTTPNTLAAAASALRQRNVGGKPSSTGTPHQITSCPWCGSEIKEQHLRVYEAPSDIGRCVTYCGEFSGGWGYSINWIEPSVDLYFSRTPTARDFAVRKGIPRERKVALGVACSCTKGTPVSA